MTSEPSEPPPDDDFNINDFDEKEIFEEQFEEFFDEFEEEEQEEEFEEERKELKEERKGLEIETAKPFSHRNIVLNNEISTNKLKSSSALSHLLLQKQSITQSSSNNLSKDEKETYLLGHDDTIPPTPSPTLEEEINSNEVMISIQDHPEYSKYLKMLKVGLPLQVIKEKIQREGYDPKYIDYPIDTLIPLNKPLKAQQQKEKKIVTIKKKRIQWIEIQKVDILQEKSIWSQNTIDIKNQSFKIDKEELINLFIPRYHLRFQVE